jgi:hypothetical protein
MRKVHHIAKSHCPVCRYRVSVTTGLGHEEKPLPGDVTLCINCVSVLIFTDNLAVREPTLKELENLTPDQHHDISLFRNILKREASPEGEPDED